MKNGKRTLALLLAALMILALGVTAAAEDAPKTGTITINRALETEGHGYTEYVGDFTLYRIFDASLAFDEQGTVTDAISYRCTDAQREIPGFTDYFVVDSANNITGVTERADGGDGYLSAEAVQWIKNHIEALGTKIDAVSQYDWKYTYGSSPDKPYYLDGNSEDGHWWGRRTFYNLPFGYYFVDSTVGSAVMINTTHPDAVITDKNQTPTLDKSITTVTNLNEEKQNKGTSPWISEDGSNALIQIGDTVSYDLTVHAVPTAVQYILSDSMGDSLTLKPETIAVKVNGEALDPANYILLASTEYKYYSDRNVNAIGHYEGDTFVADYTDLLEQPEYYNRVYISDAQFVVIFKQAFLDTITNAEGLDIVVSYDAVVNEKAANTGPYPTSNSNTAVLNYGNSYTIYDYANVNSLQLIVYKYEGSDASSSSASRPLNGVGFVLAREDGKYFQQNPDTLAITWVDDINQATKLVTGTQMMWDYSYQGSYYGQYVQVARDGYFLVDGLTGGTYILIETDPLPGFNRAPDIRVTIPGANNQNSWRTQVNVANKTGTLLPSTGGAGVAMFYELGLAALAIGAILMMLKKHSGSRM